MKNLFKKGMVLFMVTLLIFTLVPPFEIFANDVRVTINGQPVIFIDQQPILIDGRTLVPVRDVFEALGFVVVWDSATATATLTRYDYTLMLTIGSYTFTNNGLIHNLDVPAQLIGNRTMLPLRFPLESIGYTTTWDSSIRTVNITPLATGMLQYQMQYTPPAPVTTPMPTPGPTPVPVLGESIFQYVYRDDVIIIQQPSFYSYTEIYNGFIITVYTPCAAQQQLRVGDVFVMEATEQNPGGIAGRVVNIVPYNSPMVITAEMLESLDEVFYDFQLSGMIDVLQYADEIVLSEYLLDADGVNIVVNTFSLREVDFTLSFTVDGITFSGSVAIMNPVLDICITPGSIFGGFNINRMVFSATTEIDVSATGRLGINRVIPLFEIPITYKEIVGVIIPIGLRITASGEITLGLLCTIEMEVGMRYGNAVDNVRFTPEFYFDIRAEASLALNIQIRVVVTRIPIYGIQGNFGKGIRTNASMQQRCPAGSCFVLETFFISNISSLNTAGLARFIPLLRFHVDLARNVQADTWFLYRGERHPMCPHAEMEQFHGLVTLGQIRPGVYIKRGDMFVRLEETPNLSHYFLPGRGNQLSAQTIANATYLLPGDRLVYVSWHPRTNDATFTSRRYTVEQNGVFFTGNTSTNIFPSYFRQLREARLRYQYLDEHWPGQEYRIIRQNPPVIPFAERRAATYFIIAIGLEPMPAAANPITAFIPGYYSHQFLRADGTLWNFSSQQVTNIFTNVSAVENYNCRFQSFSVALRNDGSLWFLGSWVHPDQQNIRDSGNNTNPRETRIMMDVVDFAVSSNKILAVHTDGSLWAFIIETTGWVGVVIDFNSPVRLFDGVNAVFASADSRYIAFLSGDNLWTWGSNQAELTWIMDYVMDVSVGGRHMVAIQRDGNIWAWGANHEGQVGDGTTEARNNPVHVLSNGIAVSAGNAHTAAVLADGSVWVWGAWEGLATWEGDGSFISTVNRNVNPMWVADDAIAVTAENFISFIIRNDGSVWAFGGINFESPESLALRFILR